MSVVYKDCLSVKEILDIITEDDNIEVRDIFIEPPNANELADEDSGDEDEGGLLDNLTARQLSATAQLVYYSNVSLEEEEEEHFKGQSKIDGQPNVSSRQTFHSGTKLQIPPKYIPGKWIKKADLVEPNLPFPPSDYTVYKGMSSVELFELFFDTSIYDYLVHQTQIYALFKNMPDPKITVDELRCFFAILILKGYNKLPGKRFYWDTNHDMRNTLVFNSMRRDRFIQIMRFIHCSDNCKINPHNKMCKVRPLMDKLKLKFLEHFVSKKNLNYDEAMVKYYGRHSCKQFIRGKPIRFGFKMWCLNAPNGYLVNFDMHQGNNPRGVQEYEEKFGKCTAPLVLRIDELPNREKFHYNFFFDNLFTSGTLLNYLRINNISGTGTVRENRLPKTCEIDSKKEMTKQPRGSYDSSLDHENGILFVRWTDNNVVTMASTAFGIEPIDTVKRFSQNEKKIVNVQRPFLIGKYNDSMGGTDQMDENIGRYRISIRSKKWWWPIFTWLIDVTIQNAWILQRKTGKKLSQLDFRREIVQAYLNKYGSERKGLGRTFSLSSGPSRMDTVRLDGQDHFLIRVPNNKRRRCVKKPCHSVIRTMCKKCDVGLCVDCFESFHKL